MASLRRLGAISSFPWNVVKALLGESVSYQTKTGMHSVKKTLTRANPFEIIVRKRINHRISYDEVFVIDRLCVWAARP
jgi:hypothetical protein